VSAPDIVVVGHGAAGLSAALSAAEAARSRGTQARIIVLECAPESELGGGSRWSPSNMRMRAPDDVAPGFEEEIFEQSGGHADRAYFGRLAREAVPTIGWLESHGIAFHRPVYYLSVGPPRIQPVGGGAAIVSALLDAAKQAGVSFLYNSAARELVAGGRGGIAGVRLESGQTLPANAVVLACGGFEGNAEMLRRHFGDAGECMPPISPGTPFNTGAGIRMAIEAGALSAGDWNGMHAEPIDPRSKESAPVVLVYPYGIVVDRNGQRFFDEGGGLVHETWEAFARQLHFATPGRKAWAILDRRLFEIADYGRAIRSEVPPVRAGSIGELAALVDIPPAALMATVASFNAAANGDARRFDATRTDGLATAAGYEPAKSNWARPLAQPPYLAWPLVGAIAYTFGGVATNADAEVLGKAGPIRGLYAAGEITGHFHGTAPNAVAMLRALVFGRIAGSNAVLSMTNGAP
jgi:tricarballylate dehydrogenase